MFENLDHNPEKSDLVSRAKDLWPQFKNRYEAIEFYCQELEKLCLTREMSVEDLLSLAESQTLYEPELMEALSLAKTIMGLKSVG